MLPKLYYNPSILQSTITTMSIFQRLSPIIPVHIANENVLYDYERYKDFHNFLSILSVSEALKKMVNIISVDSRGKNIIHVMSNDEMTKNRIEILEEHDLRKKRIGVQYHKDWAKKRVGVQLKHDEKMNLIAVNTCLPMTKNLIIRERIKKFDLKVKEDETSGIPVSEITDYWKYNREDLGELTEEQKNFRINRMYYIEDGSYIEYDPPINKEVR